MARRFVKEARLFKGINTLALTTDLTLSTVILELSTLLKVNVTGVWRIIYQHSGYSIILAITAFIYFFKKQNISLITCRVKICRYFSKFSLGARMYFSDPTSVRSRLGSQSPRFAVASVCGRLGSQSPRFAVGSVCGWLGFESETICVVITWRAAWRRCERMRCLIVLRS